MWQRRLIDVVPITDFTSNKPGETVVLDSARVIECPACKRSGIVMDGEEAQFVVHKFGAGGMPSDICAPLPEGNSEMKVFDMQGNLAYEGILPEHKKDEHQN